MSSGPSSAPPPNVWRPERSDRRQPCPICGCKDCQCGSSIAREPNSHHPAIEPWQRFTRSRPCPICTGGDTDRRGRGERCAGYISKDQQYAFCTREEFAGDLEPHDRTSPATYKHRLHGPCTCGRGEHGAAAEVRPMPAGQPARSEAKTPRRSHQRVRPDQIHLYRNVNGSERFRVLRIGDGAGKRHAVSAPR